MHGPYAPQVLCTEFLVQCFNGLLCHGGAITAAEIDWVMLCPGLLFLAGGAVTLTCSKGTSWQSGGKEYVQYNCVLHSAAAAPVNDIKLSCSNFVPTAQWNINPDCTLPNTTLYPGQDLGIGYQTTSGPATISVTSYNTLPQGAPVLHTPLLSPLCPSVEAGGGSRSPPSWPSERPGRAS